MLINLRMTMLSGLATSFVRLLCSSFSSKAITAAIVVTAVAVLLPTCEAQAQTTIRMNGNQRLDKGQSIVVAGKGRLIMQPDGNLVLYDAANQPRWATGTNGKAVTHVIMQPDGNLVIYNNAARGVGIGHLERERPRRLLRDRPRHVVAARSTVPTVR